MLIIQAYKRTPPDGTMQARPRPCGWIPTQQDENQIWLWIELKIDYRCSEGRNLDAPEDERQQPNHNEAQ